METTIILGLHRGYIGTMENRNGNYCILGLYRGFRFRVLGFRELRFRVTVGLDTGIVFKEFG